MSEPEYKLVPIEPSQVQLFAMQGELPEHQYTYGATVLARAMYSAALEFAPSPPQDQRDEDAQEIKRLRAAWDSSHQQAMENGAKYKQAEEALRVAREALEFYADPDNCNEDGFYVEPAIIADSFYEFHNENGRKATEALRQIKELMGEK